MPRVLTGVWLIALACWATGLAAPVSAQPTISQDTATASAPLSPGQSEQIDQFVVFWLGELANAQLTDDVRRARNQIVTQVTLPQTSEAFRDAFAGSFVKNADPLLVNGPLVVRLNTMIVMSQTRRLGVLDLAGRVLVDDENPAVRYWAARTIEQVVVALQAENQQIPNELRRDLLQALQVAAAGEKAPTTLAQVFSAMASLGAINELIQSLDGRLAAHVDDPSLLFLPERRAMEQLYIELVRQLAAQGQVAMEPTIVELSRVALLYLTVASTQLAEAAEMDADLVQDKRRMVEQADLVLRWAVNELGQAGVLPPPIANAVRIQDWGAIVGQLGFWQRELTLSPFDFREAQLSPGGEAE
ncbi:MAG: hypothetical protein AAGB29_09105 [Planctomycetota bacterium]